MKIVLVGINYQTAALALRERLYLSDSELREALTALQSENLTEVVGVSTCNRLEIYASAIDAGAAVETLRGFLALRVALPPRELDKHLQIMHDLDAVEHLMRVAAGLESPILGETEILGQVAAALKQAQAADTVNGVLTRLFQDATRAGKRARSDTAISQHTLSLSHAAVLVTRQSLDLRETRALIVGAGQMAEQAARAFSAQGAAVQIVNRTFERAAALAAKVGGEAIKWEQHERAVHDADVIVTATSAPSPILNASDLAGSTPVLVLDIGMPRNVDCDVALLPNVHLYDLDDLQGIVDEHRALRQSEIAPVEAIISEEMQAYADWLNSRSAVATIVALYQKADAVIENELTRAFHRLPDLSEHEREVLATMAHRIANKLLHAPAATLRDGAGTDRHFERLAAARQLFDLKAEAEIEQP